MSEFNISSILDALQYRIKCPFFGSFCFSFFGFNWRELFYLLFNKTATIPERIGYFDSNTGWLSLFFCPLAAGAVLAVAMPWVNLIFAKAIAGAKTGRQNLVLDSKRATLIKRRKIAEEEAQTLEAENAIDHERFNQKLEERKQYREAMKQEEYSESEEYRRRSEKRKLEEKEDIEAHRERHIARLSNEIEDREEIQRQLGREAIELLNEGKPLTLKLAGSLTKLFFGFIPSLDIKDIVSLENLEFLNFGMDTGTEDNLKNWEEIRKLKRLEILAIENSNITNIEPLKYLTELKFLCLDNSNVEDIAPLEKLINLKSLYLNSTNVKDIAVLKNLVNLEELQIAGVKISDWSPVDHVDKVEGRPKDWIRKVI